MALDFRMNTVSIDEHQALSFFAVEPVPRDIGEPWLYNDWAYEISRGDTSLSFSLAPAQRDVRIIVHVHGQKVYELNAMSVLDVQYHSDADSEWIEVALSENNSIILRVNPAIEISQVFRV